MANPRGVVIAPVALVDPNLRRAGRTGGAHGPVDSQSPPVNPQRCANKNLGVRAIGAGLMAMAMLARPHC